MNENEDVLQNMIGSVIELQKISNDFQQQANTFLERIASQRGLMANKHEKVVIEKLKTQGKLTKREIMGIIGLSPQGALDLMKRLDGRENIFYMHGRGKHTSYLLMALGNSSEARAMQIARLIPRGSSMLHEEIIEKLGIGEDDFRHGMKAMREMFKGEFSFEGGKIIHFR